MKALLANPLKAGRVSLFCAAASLVCLFASLFAPYALPAALLPNGGVVPVIVWTLLAIVATITGVAGLRTRAGRIALLLVVLSIPAAIVIGAYHEHQADTFQDAELVNGPL
ncbi:MAG: hypothetical protein H0U25_06185 [Thermoleophilaceae bacterium]|nr:hypothetical protein [Thermoleophilaceae bacterium]